MVYRTRSIAAKLIAMLIVASPALAGFGENDLSQPGDVARGTTSAQILDTRRHDPQVRDMRPFDGRKMEIRHRLPHHSKPDLRRFDPPNDLPVGANDLPPRVSPPRVYFPGISQTPWVPPDPCLAVGPTHVVATVNMAIAFYQKGGEVEFFQYLDNTGDPGFFEDIGGGNFTFDPKCIYDQYTGRFLVLALEVYGPSEAWITIAISDDSDPNGTWYKYRTDAVVTDGDQTYWVDYPGLGCDENGYYVTGNLFGLNQGGWGGVLFRAFDKTPLLSGEDATWVDLRDKGAASVQVAECHGQPAAPFFVSLASDSKVRIHAIKDPFGDAELVKTDVTVPTFKYPAGGANNKGGSIDVLDGRLMNAHWRDGKLYTCHTTWLGGLSEVASARWYALNTNAWPNSGKPALQQSGNITDGTGVHTFFPAIYANKFGDVGLVVGRSSADDYASVEVTGRKKTDQTGKMGKLQRLKLGETAYNGRWGDYFDACADPANDSVMWVVGEYANSNGWATWIGSILISKFNSDLNCDGSVDFNDIDPWVMALTAPDDYAKAYAGCDPGLADSNCDGTVDFNDIDAFVQCLTQGGCENCD